MDRRGAVWQIGVILQAWRGRREKMFFSAPIHHSLHVRATYGAVILEGLVNDVTLFENQ